jgi:uncharacterized protein with ParB-like and HNH nuclease domain
VSLRDKILRLKVIFVELGDEDDAYIIFETLNTRGKDLEVSHLVKNHLMKYISTKQKGVDIPKDKWEGILKSFLESEADISINALIHHHWLSKYKFVAEKRLFKDIKTSVKKANAKSYLDELVIAAKTYRVIHEPGSRAWRVEQLEIKESLSAPKPLSSAAAVAVGSFCPTGV